MSSGTNHFQFRSNQVCGRVCDGNAANAGEGGVVIKFAGLAGVSYTKKHGAANGLWRTGAAPTP